MPLSCAICKRVFHRHDLTVCVVAWDFGFMGITARAELLCCHSVTCKPVAETRMRFWADYQRRAEVVYGETPEVPVIR